MCEKILEKFRGKDFVGAKHANDEEMKIIPPLTYAF